MFIRKLSDGSAFVAVDFPDVAGKETFVLLKKFFKAERKILLARLVIH